MKKSIVLLIIVAFFVSLGTVSCKKKDDATKTYSELIVGRWKTSDGGHYEVYYSNGTGKMWDPADDVQEDEADTFNWTMDEGAKQMMLEVNSQELGFVVMQYCNILTLNESTLKYNNDGWKATYNMTKVN